MLQVMCSGLGDHTDSAYRLDDGFYRIARNLGFTSGSVQQQAGC